jgi:hypothetical protein
MKRIVTLFTGLALFAGSASAETVERTVKANSTTALGGFFGYEVDTCYPSVIPDVKVRQSPAHGTFKIVPHEQVLGEGNRCKGTKVRGLAYVYTPAKGFKGNDEVVVDVPWVANDLGQPVLYTYTYRVKVE